MTRHDDHYAQMAIQPIEMMEQILQRENIPPIPRAHIATAGHYLNRAGTKEDWRKDAEKASNYLYRALHGVWPWDMGGDLDKNWVQLKRDLDNPVQKMCDAEHSIPPRDSGEALVGRECWVWSTVKSLAIAKRIRSIEKKNAPYLYGLYNGDWVAHAQPVELGHPDPNHPEYRGER